MNLFRNNKNYSVGVFNDRLWDEFFDTQWGRHRNNVQMKTDIKEEDDKFILEIDVPGFDREDIKLSMEEGYLKVEAFKEESKEEDDKKGTYLRRERYYGSCSRCYYVGDIKQESIKASHKNGILSIAIPKQNPKEVEVKKYISIE